MKDLRVYISNYILKQENIRENKAINLSKKFRQCSLSKKNDNILRKEYWLHTRYGIEESRHADIENDAIFYASKKSKENNRKDLYTWYYHVRYFGKITLEKIDNLFNRLFF